MPTKPTILIYHHIPALRLGLLHFLEKVGNVLVADTPDIVFEMANTRPDALVILGITDSFDYAPEARRQLLARNPSQKIAIFGDRILLMRRVKEFESCKFLFDVDDETTLQNNVVAACA